MSVSELQCVLTHIDSDHIEGILRLFSQKNFDFSIIKEMWFNFGEGLHSMVAASASPNNNSFISPNSNKKAILLLLVKETIPSNSVFDFSIIKEMWFNFGEGLQNSLGIKGINKGINLYDFDTKSSPYEIIMLSPLRAFKSFILSIIPHQYPLHYRFIHSDNSFSISSNFQMKLPEPQSDLAAQTLKDPYNFDFLTMREEYDEKELEDALVNQITQFLLELGTGFSYLGRQVHCSNYYPMFSVHKILLH